MEIFCKQFSKKIALYLAQEDNSQPGGEGGEGEEEEGPQGSEPRPHCPGSGRGRRGDAGYKKFFQNNKKQSRIFYKFIQVFTSERIFPTRELLHQQAKRMKMDFNEEEEDFVDDDEEEEEDDKKAEKDAAYWESQAKRLLSENSALRKRIAAAEASK